MNEAHFQKQRDPAGQETQRLSETVAIVVLAYNGTQYLPELFASLEHLDFPKERFEIVVVDNGSTDQTVSYVQTYICRTRLPITLLQSAVNLGFAGGNNLGMCYALDKGFAFIVLLNQDTVVEPDWLTELLCAARSVDQMGAVQSLIVLHDQPEKINTAGNKLHFLGFGYCGHYKTDVGSFWQPQGAVSRGRRAADDDLGACDWYPPIAYPSGAAVLFASEALRTVGLFDESLFLYHEDLDLGWRLRLYGYRVFLAPQSKVQHKYAFSRNPLKFYWMERNRLLVTLKNYKWRTLLLFVPAFLLMEIGMLLYAFRIGCLQSKWRSYFDVLRQSRELLAKRRVLQRHRKVSDRDIVRHLADRVEFEDLMSPSLRNLINTPFICYWWLVRRLVRW